MQNPTGEPRRAIKNQTNGSRTEGQGARRLCHVGARRQRRRGEAPSTSMRRRVGSKIPSPDACSGSRDFCAYAPEPTKNVPTALPASHKARVLPGVALTLGSRHTGQSRAYAMWGSSATRPWSGVVVGVCGWPWSP